MKKLLLLSLALPLAISAFSQKPENWDGVEVLPGFYSFKVSQDGVQVIGDAEDGSAVYYNRSTGEAYYYGNCTFGQGFVVADNGWVVGSELKDLASQTNVAVIMSKGEITTPAPFTNHITSNIHSITPDASRICGVYGGGAGPMNVPYYCDIDANGNFGELIPLPTPPTDFFGAKPLYCTATWMTNDGKTIAGQVVDGRGLFRYPIVYREDEQGVWSYSLPSQSLFNPEGLTIPKPLGDFEDEYPDVSYPDPLNYISPDRIKDWEAAYNKWETNNFAEEYDPYTHLDLFMTESQIQDYTDAVSLYDFYVEEYNEKNIEYWETMIALADTSVLFVHNAQAMSVDGKWLASSAEMPATVEGAPTDEPIYLYIPYLFNLETGEYKKIGLDNMDLVTNQVLPDGTVICATPMSAILPPTSYIYQRSTNKMVPFQDYISEVSPEMRRWMSTYLSSEIQVGENEFERALITGLVTVNEDMSTVCGGVMASALNYDYFYMTYMMSGLEAGIEDIIADAAVDGVYRVYNLQGVKVMETKDASALRSLAKGLYIVNGKKVII